MKDNIGQKIDEYIRNMPSLPISVTKILEVCSNPQVSPADLNRVISLDPVLVGRVLKLINSAYYGLSHKITNLVRAIIMLGINTVKNLALSSTVMGSFVANKATNGIDIEGFWRHSLCVGVIARLLAEKRKIDRKMRDVYFHAGLLHDIGKIPLNAMLKKRYYRIVAAADQDKISLYLAEERALKLDHCAAGAAIVRAWKLDGAVGDAIIYHHNYADYSGPYSDILYSVIVANRIATMERIGFSGDKYPENIEKNLWETLKLDEEFFHEIEDAVKNEIAKAESFLRI